MKPSEIRRNAQSVFLSAISVIILATAGTAIFSFPGLAQASSTLTFIPVADSYVKQSDPTHNYASNNSIRVDDSQLVRTYLRFNVSGIGGRPVTKVALRIFANSSSGAGFTVNKVDDNNWKENGINYNNAPVPGNQLVMSNAFSANMWVSMDATSLLNADGTVSNVLSGIDQQAINLAARESGSLVPQLLVEVSAPSNPTTTFNITPNITPTRTSAPSATVIRTFLPIISVTKPTEPTPPGDFQPVFPIRAVFYYPWFPEAWNQQGYNPFTHYTPSIGFYDSSSVSIIQAHISAMTYGNIHSAILSWWGQGSKSDQRVATILGATPSSSNPNFRWAIYYETESQGNPTVAQIQNDLQYIQSHYGMNPSFLRVNGKFVVFVYADTADACGMADRWVQADNNLGHPAYIVLKVFAGFRTCASQPDSWHQYSPAVANDRQSGYSYAISPGFWMEGNAVRLARNLTTWKSNVSSMVASGEPWQLITTFNEWGEGTSVESAVEWASPSGYGQYMDVLHDNGN